MPEGAGWQRVRARRLPSFVIRTLERYFQHFLSDIWQSGYRQGARDARRADTMAEAEKQPQLCELVTRHNQRVEVLVERRENAIIGVPWTPFNK